VPLRPLTAHRLTDGAFAALAAGRPDATTVAELRRAQLSRHLLMLREIVRAAPTTTMRGYERLAAAEVAAPEAVRAALGGPLVGVWAATTLTGGDTEPDYLARLADSALGRPAGDTARRIVVTHGGMRLDVAIEDTDPLRGRLGLAPAGRLTDDDVDRWAKLLGEAWRLLVTRHPAHARLIGDVLACIVPVQPDASARGISATSADAFGAVAMSAPADAAALAVGLLHETRHSVLNAVQYLFDLHTRDLPTQDPARELPATDRHTHAPDLRYSPWRDDPRPATGVLHGAYAYLGVTDFWRVERAGGDPVAAFEFARWRAAVAAATGGLLSAGTLTPAGTRFVAAMRNHVLPWLEEPVDPDVLRLAEGANTDHRLRWRLRNLTVDPAGVAALAGAWRRGDPAGPLPASAVRAAGRRELESNARLDLVHRHLRGAAGTAEPGDAAYLRGAPAVASAAYRRTLEAGADDLAAWAGLGLTSGYVALRERPEVVAALHRALGARTDPIGLAAWLT
jgi:hypothetical protein